MIESSVSKGSAALKVDKPSKEEVGALSIFLSFVGFLALGLIGGKLVASGK